MIPTNSNKKNIYLVMYRKLTFPSLMASLEILTTLLTLDAIHKYLKNLCNEKHRRRTGLIKK